MALCRWSLLVTAFCSTAWPLTLPAWAPENDVALTAVAWLPEGRVTAVHLPKDHPRRLYFTLPKRASAMSVTIIPCDVPIEWSLTVKTREDKTLKPHWTTRKSMPEVWWRHPGKTVKMYSNIGNAVDTYTGSAHAPASLYIVRLQSREQDTQVSVYLQEGWGPPGVFPQLPADPQVYVVGTGMSSVTLRWAPSSSAWEPPEGSAGQRYCVLVNLRHNYRGLCAALEAMRKDRRAETQERQGATLWPKPKAQQWQGGQNTGERIPASPVASHTGLPCACWGPESSCTVSELQPDTRYYFDVFAVSGPTGASAAYTGTSVRTRGEARAVAAAALLRDGKPRRVELSPRGSRLLSFRPRGWPPRALLTLQGCGSPSIKVTVSSQGRMLAEETVAGDPAQIWLQGSPSYLIKLENVSPETVPPGAEGAIIKIQASSAYHRQVPALPATLSLKAFSKLRTCDSITIAWHGTEERNLYCVYRRRLDSGGPDQCPGPEARNEGEKAVCKYFQELNPQRAVSTATISGLEPATAYLIDVYMMRRFGIAIKYQSKAVSTRKDC